MNRLKKVLAIALSAALMVPSTAFAAYKDSVGIKLDNDQVSLSTEYTGKDQTLTIVVNGYTLVEGKDFQIVGTEPKSVGTHTVKIVGIGTVKGSATITYKIKKASEPVLTVSPKVEKQLEEGFKAKELKKESKTINLNPKSKKPKKDKNNKTDKNKGNKNKKKKKLKLEFSAKGKKSKKWLKVTKNGKVTLKKGIKKGVYKVRVKTNRGTKNYKKGTTVVKIVVK